MVKRLLTFIVLSSLVSACSEEAPNWVAVGSNPDMHVYVAKAESDSRIKAPKIVVKMLWDYNYPQIRSEGEFRSVVVKLLIDCEQFKAADFAYTNYSDNMAKGSVVATGERDVKVAMYGLREIQNPSTKEVAALACRQYQ